MEEEHNISECDSDDDPIIPSPVVEAAAKKKPAKARFVRSKETSVTTRKPIYGILDFTPEGPLHIPVKNNGSSEDFSTKHKVGPIDLDRSGNDSLVQNLQKAKSNSIKQHFHKDGHIVSNSSTRKAHRPSTERIAKRYRSDDDMADMEDNGDISENKPPADSYAPMEEDSEPTDAASANEDRVESVESEDAMRGAKLPEEVEKISIEDHEAIEGEELVLVDESPAKEEEDLKLTSTMHPLSTDSSTDRVLRSRIRGIDSAIFLEKGSEMMKNALKKDLVLLPDFHRLDESDVVMFSVDSLTPSNTGPPTPMPPKPSPDAKFFGVGGNVDLPWTLDYITEDGLNRGMIIKRELKIAAEQGFTTLDDFKNLMQRIRSAKSIPGLAKFYDKQADEELRKVLLHLLREIVKLALRGPELFTAPLPELRTTEDIRYCSVSLSQEQCACLLACSFLGLMPFSEKTANFNDFDLSALMMYVSAISIQKLRFIFNYFSTVVCQMPTGVVTFRRVAYLLNDMNIKTRKEFSTAMLRDVGTTNAFIEDCPRLLQVDFANQCIGGGVLGHGFVQEEIRFLCCPEMMVSMLLSPKMKDNEAIFIAGAQQYSSYVNYGPGTKFRPLESDINQPRDKFRRIMCEVVAIDATEYASYYDRRQFDEAAMNREIRKAYAGFNTSLKDKPPIATGNWGCGAFHGRIRHKCIIQWIAASMAGRDIVYCVVDKIDIVTEFCDLVKKLKKKGAQVGDVYESLLKYRHFAGGQDLFDFIDSRFCT